MNNIELINTNNSLYFDVHYVCVMFIQHFDLQVGALEMPIIINGQSLTSPHPAPSIPYPLTVDTYLT